MMLNQSEESKSNFEFNNSEIESQPLAQADTKFEQYGEQAAF
jgi:hypothetical protein